MLLGCFLEMVIGQLLGRAICPARFFYANYYYIKPRGLDIALFLFSLRVSA